MQLVHTREHWEAAHPYSVLFCPFRVIGTSEGGLSVYDFPTGKSLKPTFEVSTSKRSMAMVTKNTTLPHPRRAVDSPCEDTITPECLQSLYGLPTGPASQSSNVLGVSGFINQWANKADQLGARGVSILFSSGDGGVAGIRDDECPEFVPTFPSGCPYLTSVGATTGISLETAASFSSGGFSNYWGTPSYQASAVSSYLNQLGDTNAGLYNASGRGFPDVSTQGKNFQVIVDGGLQNVWGTSCASPTFASVIALINDELVAAGESTLGFLNPWLYSSAGSALHDVTSVSNLGCDTDGFPALSGWDPVTGLGTPNYAAMKAAAGL